jgi:hypothetical protein
MIKSKSYKIYLLVVGILISSCGLKITNEISENVFMGSWTLDYVACYNSEEENTVIEKYEFENLNHDVIFDFEGRDFSYEVASNCTTTAHGVYSTEFDGDSKGYVEFSKIDSGSTCDLSIPDSGPNSVSGPTSVDMAILPSKSSDLFWLVDGTTMELELGTGFRGSSENPGCQGLCFCKGYFLKN